jgi:hypothetical protein
MGDGVIGDVCPALPKAVLITARASLGIPEQRI